MQKTHITLGIGILLLLLGCSGTPSRDKQVLECLNRSVVDADRIIINLDSIYYNIKKDKPGEIFSYHDFYQCITNQDIILDPLKIWNKGSHPMDFYSPVYLRAISECLKNNRNILSRNDYLLYVKISKFPYLDKSPYGEIDGYIKQLLEDGLSDLDKFFYYYLIWYKITLLHYA